MCLWPQVDSASWSLWTWARRMQSAALLAASLACALVACLGAGLLAFLFVARTFAPATAHIVQPLYFDYTQLEATASVSLLNSQRATYYAHSLHELNHKVCPPVMQLSSVAQPGRHTEMFDMRQQRSHAAQ